MTDNFYLSVIVLTFFGVFLLLGLEIENHYYHQDDINKDGKTNIVDLSVLAERIRNK